MPEKQFPESIAIEKIGWGPMIKLEVVFARDVERGRPVVHHLARPNALIRLINSCGCGPWDRPTQHKAELSPVSPHHHANATDHVMTPCPWQGDGGGWGGRS